jgi:iron complex transport system permease protein
LASILGSVSFVLLVVLLVSHRLRDTMAILIIGLMFEILLAIVGTLTYFSTAEQLQNSMFWSMGTLGYHGSYFFLSDLFCRITLSFFSIKPLNALLLY